MYSTGSHMHMNFNINPCCNYEEICVTLMTLRWFTVRNLTLKCTQMNKYVYTVMDMPLHNIILLWFHMN